MCGIVAYTGKNNAVPYLIDALKKLEYRGYDSAGIALLDRKGISVLKRKGKVSALSEAINDSFCANTGIGHTRWATHGEPSQANAHPHLSENGMFAVVHNGIIENSGKLRDELEKQGYSFLSDTDTEVISQLLEKNYKGDILSCLEITLKALEGSFALAILHRDFPDKIICGKMGSPLIVARSHMGYFALSDLVAADNSCEEYYCLNDGEIAILTGEETRFFTFDGEEREKAAEKADKSFFDNDKKGYEHYMLKEIYQQPDALYQTLTAYVNEGEIDFPNFRISREQAKSIDKIYLVACGSAYHAALCGKYALEKLTDLPVFAYIASEFRYEAHRLNKNSLVIAISQSGETADTLAALTLSAEKGATTLAVINVKTSAMAQKADYTILTLAGTEISVATTKAYTCQTAVLYMLALFLGEKRSTLDREVYSDFLENILYLPSAVKNSFSEKEKAVLAAEKLKDKEHIYFIGRSTDYALAMEGALKMKEISYIHCEAYAAGELKHGSISLIDKGTPVIAVCLRQDLFKKTLSAVSEVKARGAFVIAITDLKHKSEITNADLLLTVESIKNRFFTPFYGIVPLQLMSYHTAVKKGCNVDRPRNLAKSVTVE